MQNVTPIAIGAFALELAPAVLFGLAAERVARAVGHWPATVRVSLPALFVAPYAMVSVSAHQFRWGWFALYAVLPVAIAGLLMHAAAADPEQCGDWRDALILLLLGLAVDLRWFESAWPNGLRALNELLLMDAGLYGFLAIRQLTGTGFDFHLRWSDWKIGLRELAFFTPPVIALGLALGFIHPHGNLLQAAFFTRPARMHAVHTRTCLRTPLITARTRRRFGFQRRRVTLCAWLIVFP